MKDEKKKLFGMEIIPTKNINKNNFALVGEITVEFSMKTNGQCPLCGSIGTIGDVCGNDGEILQDRQDIYNPLLHSIWGNSD